jgi:FlaG/FlaF family flagellin (archaellin)
MTPLPSFFTSKLKTRKRSGVSPVIATTIILAITVVLGLSLWSFANSGVSAATQNYSDVVTEYGKFTADKFVIAGVAFNHPSNGHVTIWVYNAGKSSTTIDSVLVTCKDCFGFTAIQLTEADLPIGATMDIPSKSLKSFDFDAIVTFNPGKTYEVQVISETGAYQTMYQKE